MTARNMLYVTEPSTLMNQFTGLAFTQLAINACHIEQNPALQKFRILNGPGSISTLFSSVDFSQWIGALDGGIFPPDLRAATMVAFAETGKTLSYEVVVQVITPGSSWMLVDVLTDNLFAMQVDLNGTFISFSGAPLAEISDSATYKAYEVRLNDGLFPQALQQAANLPGPNFRYAVTQVPNQVTGLPQWLITDTTNGFIYFVAIGSQSTPDVMVVRNYQYVLSPNVAAFMLSLAGAGVPTLLSLGGWADATTWSIMGQNTQQAAIVVAEALDQFGLAGVDFDWEQVEESNAQQAADVKGMTAFVQLFRAQLPDTIFTICPYGDTISTLLSVWQNVGLDAIAWANCQYYGNTSDGFSTTFLEPIATTFNLASASAAAPYATAGFTATDYTATSFANAVSAFVNAIPTIGGVFTYALGAVVTSAVQTWASDVATALLDD